MKIQMLPPHVADMVAAGEVVERPGSVVKELVENAIDAGATTITVEIEYGGMGLIRVSDNGCGMSPGDACEAFKRHATSKLRDEHGLDAISTLGFRGEALAAIAAVSRVDLFTRESGEVEGYTISLEAGELIAEMPAGCPEGTSIIVRDLFFNIPARFKFMKKDSTEAAHVSAVVTRCALAHPEISFRFLKDGKEESQTPGSSDLKSCAYTLLGRDTVMNTLAVECESNDVRVWGLVSSPVSVRGNRRGQYFFVNGRYIRSTLLQSAFEQAYRNSLPTGRFPICVLHLGIKYTEVDVNVHPAKTEIKFQHERKVFDSVYYAVKTTLDGKTALPNLQSDTKKNENQPEVFGSDDRKPVRRDNNPESNKPNTEELSRFAPGFFRNSGHDMLMSITKFDSDLRNNVHESEIPIITDEQKETLQIPITEIVPENDSNSYEIIGEVFSGYIIAQKDESLLIIDKHAAHERVIFDMLKNNERTVMSQLLIAPLVVEPDEEDKALLMENLDLFDKLGFEIEDFGVGSVVIRRLPADIFTDDAAALLAELCRSLRYGGHPGYLSVEDEIISTMACKAAIKIGTISEPDEWNPVVQAVVSGKVQFCPHGRPVTMTLTKSQLEKNFKRK